MDMELSPFEALLAATEVAGTQSAFAKICGVSQNAVWKWLQSSKRLPAEHVLAVEAATGVSRHMLRPDIYPVEHAGRPLIWRALDRREHVVTFSDGPVSLGDTSPIRRAGALR